MTVTIPASRGVTRYHLQDQQQDLLYLDISSEGVIVGVSPYCSDTLANIYIGQVCYDYFTGTDLAVGMCPQISKGPEHPISTLRYAVVKIENVDHEYESFDAAAALIKAVFG